MGSKTLKSHSIEIAGQKVSLRSDAAETHVRRLADLVNARVRAAREAAPGASIQSALALVSIQLADDLADVEERLGQERREAAGDIRKLVARLTDGAEALERWTRDAREGGE